VANERSTARTRSGSEGTSDRALESVRIRLLGGFEVSVGSRTIENGEWPLRKAANLLKLLALASAHRMHREEAMDLLWPDSGRISASNNLRRTLYMTRRAIDSWSYAEEKIDEYDVYMNAHEHAGQAPDIP
jgi:two-component SAPR family response regulator